MPDMRGRKLHLISLSEAERIELQVPRRVLAYLNPVLSLAYVWVTEMKTAGLATSLPCWQTVQHWVKLKKGFINADGVMPCLSKVLPEEV